MKAWRLTCLTSVCAALALGCGVAWAKDPPRSAQQVLLAQNASPQRAPDVPFVPTIDEVVAEMLRLGQVGKNDFVIDLGSGDGRIPITAAKKYGARGFGVDIDPQRVRESQDNAKKAGVEDKVRFMQGDLFNTDISKATVVTLYLLPSVNLRLRPKLLAELKPGTRVVSHNYDMGDWKPDQVVNVGSHTVYLWTIPERGGQATGQQK
jgi:precorrin-6B methylase 2